MRANHRCAVVIRQVRGACSRAARSLRLCSCCAVMWSAFSETDKYRVSSKYYAIRGRFEVSSFRRPKYIKFKFTSASISAILSKTPISLYTKICA